MKIAAAVAIFLVLISVTPPAEPRWRLCPFHWLTGLDCPLCGLTRALFALAKGHWAESARFHGLAPLAVVMLAALVWRTRWTRPLWTAGLAAFALYGVMRCGAANPGRGPAFQRVQPAESRLRARLPAPPWQYEIVRSIHK